MPIFWQERLMNKEKDRKDTRNLEWWLTIAIPLVSFGGILAAILLKESGKITNAGEFAWGCVAGSFLLGYLAYIKPKKDIVAICAPIYGIIFFLVPVEETRPLLLQVLFAASITALLVRLNRKFSSSADDRGGSEPMEHFLRDYIERIKPEFKTIQEKTAHEIASAFLAFKFGLYQNAIDECRLASAQVPTGGSNDALRKALQIVQLNAEDLENAQVTADTRAAFSESEHPFVAINLQQEAIEDPASLELDNALILLYAVAKNTSPDDELALDEHQKFVLKILTSYKAALGIA
jgi:hypothetical protein